MQKLEDQAALCCDSLGFTHLSCHQNDQGMLVLVVKLV